ncbi:MAG: hypothetical protein ACRDKZ_04290 [Actinomycetota bacterium]
MLADIRKRKWLAALLLVVSLGAVACEGSADVDAPGGGNEDGGGEDGGGADVDVDVGEEEGEGGDN